MAPNFKIYHKCAFLHFQETLSLDFLEMNFPKIVVVSILCSVISGKKFSFWAIDQLDWPLSNLSVVCL